MKVIFWSSVDAAMFLPAIVDSIRKSGFSAEHRSVISSKFYRKASTFWERLFLRVRMYIEYPLRLAWACAIDSESRILVVTTNTFFAPFVAILFSRKNQMVIHLVWDLFPDALIQGDNDVSQRWILNKVQDVVQIIFLRSAANVFIGQRLLEHAKTRFREVPKAYIISVGSNSRVFANCRPILVPPVIPIEILYCGTIGSMHDTLTIINSLRAPVRITDEHTKYFLCFNSSGPIYEVFKKQVKEIDSVAARNIRFESTLSDSEWIQRMKNAQVALVTMKQGAEKVVMPSKTYGALAAGQAILAICPSDSDLARLVRSENCGWVVTPGCVAELRIALKEIALNRNLLQIKRENAYNAGQNKFCESKIGSEWVKLINNLLTK